MAHEHCYALDSHLPFLSGNYGINTTSEIEWWFVRAPGEAGLKECGLSKWPAEEEG